MRIIGGQYRRTPLAVLDAPGLRPTPDRVRETLFNWLNHMWQGDFASRRVLDLFAGTGALGLEAASRGAAHVTLVEADRRVLAALRQSVQRLGAGQVTVAGRDAAAFVAEAAGARPGFDLILLDPPFGAGWLERLWPGLPALLAPGGLVYVEAEAAFAAPPGFVAVRQAKAGAVHYHLLRGMPAEEAQ